MSIVGAVGFFLSLRQSHITLKAYEGDVNFHHEIMDILDHEVLVQGQAIPFLNPAVTPQRTFPSYI